MIRDSKERDWKELCNAVDNGPWGLPYKLVVGKLVGHSSPIYNFESGKELSISQALFPVNPRTDWSSISILRTELTVRPEHFSNSELIMAAKRLPTGKAAGPDGTVSEIISAISIKKPSIMLSVFNACLLSEVFPDAWKEARIVLLHKGVNKDPVDPSSFRPISVINSAGKLMERLILQRLETHLDSVPNGRSQN